jgi:hypothetical protein
LKRQEHSLKRRAENLAKSLEKPNFYFGIPVNA